MLKGFWGRGGMTTVMTVVAVVGLASSAQAEIDGHGPDAWGVVGVSTNDFLNARMGPGTNYPVLDKFAYNERFMQQITCVPFYTSAHYMKMTQTQIDTMPAQAALRAQSACCSCAHLSGDLNTRAGGLFPRRIAA